MHAELMRSKSERYGMLRKRHRNGGLLFVRASHELLQWKLESGLLVLLCQCVRRKHHAAELRSGGASVMQRQLLHNCRIEQHRLLQLSDGALVVALIIALASKWVYG